MRFEQPSRLAFSRLEAGLVLLALVLLVLVLIPAFFPPRPLVLAPEIPEPPTAPSAPAAG